MLFAIPSASFGCITAMLHETSLFLGQLWQLFEVSQILEFLRFIKYTLYLYILSLLHFTGVEAQTLTVWRQANKFHVPCIVYLNKMDKPTANLDMCLRSIQEKLHVEPIVISLPYEVDAKFAGVVDLVSMEQVVWDMVKDPQGTVYKSVPLLSSECDIDEEDWRRARSTLIGQLSDFDETIAEYVLSDKDLDKLPVSVVRNALRNITLSHKSSVLVLCGSSLRNKGVQPLLDAITDYLPSPLDVSHHFLEYYRNELCALAFKIIHDKQRGALTFLRIYGGLMKSGQHLYNVNLGANEKISRLLQVNADEFRDIKELGPGNIVCVAGLKDVSCCFKDMQPVPLNIISLRFQKFHTPQELEVLA